MNWLKLTVACLLLSGTALFLDLRDRTEVLVPRQQLAAIPAQLGAWDGKDVNISTDVLDVLGHGDFLSRLYHTDAGRTPDIELFIAYFPSQRFGDTIHSPQHCLPGSGWLPLESTKVELSFAGHAPFSANRYVIAKGEDRRLVLYWYLGRNRPIANEYWARFYLFVDSFRLNRTDGSLIRLITPLRSNEDLGSAQQRLVSLAGHFMPNIELYVPN